MQSLKDLNNYSSTASVSYTDERAPTVIFDRETPTNQTQNTLEGQIIAPPIGLNINEIVNYNSVATKYQINVSNITGATVTWPTVPSGTITSNPSSGVYEISNLISNAQWDIIKQPTINLPEGQFGTKTYTASVIYTIGNVTTTKSWTVTANITEVVDITFDRNFPANQTQTASESASIAIPLGMDITAITTSQVRYQINLSNIPGSTLTWATTPSGATTSTPSANVYQMAGITTLAAWDAVKTPTINLANDYNGSTSYTATIFYTVNGVEYSKTWTVNLTVNAVDDLSTPSRIIYSANTTQSITTLQITDTGPQNPVYTLTMVPSITSSITTLSAGGSGGTVTFDNVNKTLTIVGTKTQVNSRLSNITMTTNNVNTDFTFTYTLTRDISSSVDIKTQTVLSQNILYLSDAGAATYNEDGAATGSDRIGLLSLPIIKDPDYTSTGNYSYRLTISPSNALLDVATAGNMTGISISLSGGVYTISGTKTNINNMLNATTADGLTGLTAVLADDYNGNITVTINLTTPQANTASKTQTITVLNTEEINSNMALSRNYVGNTSNLIFAANTPQIIDYDDNVGISGTIPTYTITLSCANGEFYHPNLAYGSTNPSSNWTYTDTRDNINALFAGLQFYPTKNYSSNTTFTYTQVKSGVTQANITVNLLGSAGTYLGTLETYSTVGSFNWTPNYSNIKYGSARVLLVGGGGGGSVGTVTNPNFCTTQGSTGVAIPGTGGGGGAVLDYSNITDFKPRTYSVIVPAGGTGGSRVSGIISTFGGNGGRASIYGGSQTALDPLIEIYAYGGSLGSVNSLGSSPWSSCSGIYGYDRSGGGLPNGTTGIVNTRGGGTGGRFFKKTVSTTVTNYVNDGYTYMGAGGQSYVGTATLGGSGCSAAFIANDASFTQAGAVATGALSDITGTNQYYGYGGPGGRISTADNSSTSYGSGGGGAAAGSNLTGNAGQQGVVIIKWS